MLSKIQSLKPLSRELIFIADKNGTILDISPNFQIMLGYKKEDYIDKNINGLIKNSNIDLDNNEGFSLLLEDSEGKSLYFDGAIYRISNEGEEVYLLSALNITDYLNKSQQKEKRVIDELTEQLEKLSYIDALTGLYNRNYIEYEMDKLNQLEDVQLGMIVCDLDNLKVINDTYGHCEGDYLLQQAAEIIKEALDEDMLAGRIGGDEFIILIKNADCCKVKEIYDKIVLGVMKHKSKSSRIQVEMSIGYSHEVSSIGATKELFRNTDKLMYLHKRQKRHKFSRAIVD